MKYILLLFLSFLVFGSAFCQDADSLICEFPDQPAEFPGGYVEMKNFMAKNLHYPEKLKEIAVEGKVILKFIVSEKGEISEIEVRKGIPGCKECDDEVVRMVKSMPNWIPGRLNGKNVKSYGKCIVWVDIE